MRNKKGFKKIPIFDDKTEINFFLYTYYTIIIYIYIYNIMMVVFKVTRNKIVIIIGMIRYNFQNCFTHIVYLW